MVADQDPGFGADISDAWRRWRSRVDLDEYDARWDRLEAIGRAVHGEADFVDALLSRDDRPPAEGLILDAGCGTGRVAAELARRDHRVVGVDNDADMLAYARRKPVDVRWEQADLATVSLAERFDVIVLAGNILAFVVPELRPRVVANLADHLRPDGALVSGSTGSVGCGFADVDGWSRAAGLTLSEAFAAWEGGPYEGGDYRVSVHRRRD